jgi:hypothetical protein
MHKKPVPITPVSIGEVKYRPPRGKPEDRMLSFASGHTADGKPVTRQAIPEVKKDA